MPPPRRPARATAGFPWWILILLIALVAAGGYYWLQRGGGPAPGAGEAPATVTAPASPGPQAGAEAPAQAPVEQAKPEEPAVQERPAGGPKYPLPAGVAQEGDPSLPELARSDEPILEALTGIAPRVELGRFGNIGDFTRRVVITVDNLPRELIPAQYSVVQRIPGALAVTREGDAMTLSQANYRRYDAFVNFAESVGAKRLVSVYLRFYPLFQQEYRGMGYPKGHFNDRVIEAIDDMLAARQVDGPIRLVQPKVHYRFEDPALESLSAGQKIMIRVGPENAARLKRLLRAIRAELVG
ncbi:DUF3014 domain-containing protein [Burkholderiaceae bacterium FT117]|uniref:DUF3014 domain-containing protein n=1 Tax=Zeimonas sediminis TaxID=2944268 RepID=UPI0023430504|nr:DUF3014 domain-containing protein [Zeimonas sediminis]MCM5571864.1 DUF3014 domain-containing protein [Zeimonas sediminis]